MTILEIKSSWHWHYKQCVNSDTIEIPIHCLFLKCSKLEIDCFVIIMLNFQSKWLYYSNCLFQKSQTGSYTAQTQGPSQAQASCPTPTNSAQALSNIQISADHSQTPTCSTTAKFIQTDTPKWVILFLLFCDYCFIYYYYINTFFKFDRHTIACPFKNKIILLIWTLGLE